MKPEAHRMITDIAISRCGDVLSEKMKSFKTEIIQGTDDEDSTQFYSRITNWHFYRANDLIPKTVNRYYGECKTTSEDILQKRIDDMKSFSTDDKEYYNNLGRVIHHIQDMSTPSHVVPVYHALFIKDHFEKYMVKHINESDLRDAVLLDNEVIDFKSIYNKSAIETLNYVDNTSFNAEDIYSITVDLPLSMFWESYNPNKNSIKGFGSYGTLHKAFKKIKDKTEVSVDDYTIQKEELDKINVYVYNKALQDTCEALIYANQL
ncbi:hypothetical protein [Sulfurimonas sp.]|uniref:hypothetical protein n=1 Tax=Sulfurimonas sp. TaxID=2022749 RepID=UPI0035694735